MTLASTGNGCSAMGTAPRLKESVSVAAKWRNVGLAVERQ